MIARARFSAIVDIVAFPVFLLSIFSAIVPEKVLPSGGRGLGVSGECTPNELKPGG